MPRLLVIVNPAAGGGRCGTRAPEAIARMRSAGLELDVIETRKARDATEIARDKFKEGTRDFVAVGGDGTGYEVVNGIFPLADEVGGGPPRLGFLPLGTGNSFLRDFTDRGAEDSIAAIVAGRRRPCDVMRLLHTRGVTYFINLMSIGFVADVNGARHRHFSAFGEVGYVFAVLTELARLHPYVLPISLDGCELDRGETTFLSFNNSKYTGGKMMMAPTADTADGLVEVVRVGALGRIDLLRTFPKIFSGTHVRHPRVSVARARKVDFQVEDEIDVMVDGEADRLRPLSLDVRPGALEVLV